MQTILVTGGAGFIGGTFVRQTVASDEWRVVNLDKLTYAGNLESLESVERSTNYRFVRGDIGDGQLVSRLLDEYRPTAVVNFAAESHVDRSIDGPLPFVETNVLGTVRLLEAAREYWQELPADEAAAFRFLHVSTDEVYGSLGEDGAFDEAHPYQPNSPYSASKAASDHFVRAYFHTYHLPVLITNCSNNYGPYQFPEKLIPLMTLNALSDKPLPVYGDGQNVRDWLFVDDHCSALDCALKRGTPGETYNIGGNCERTNLQVVEAICDAVDQLAPGPDRCRDRIHFVTDRPGHDFRYAIDSAKIQQELGWEPSVDFEAGLQQTIDWYLKHPDWVHGVTSGNYRGERLGLRGPVDGSLIRAA